MGLQPEAASARGRWLRSLPLAVKVGAALAVAALALPIAGSLWASSHAYRTVESQVLDAQRAALSAFLGRIEVAHAAAVGGATAGAEDPALALAVAGGDAAGVRAALANTRQLGFYRRVAVYDTAGAVVAADPATATAPAPDGPPPSSPEVAAPAPGEGGVLVTVRAAVRSDGVVVGQLLADIGFSDLVGGASGLRLPGGVDVTVVDDRAVILASPLGAASEGARLRAPEAIALAAGSGPASATYFAPRFGYDVISTIVPAEDHPWEALATTARASALADAEAVQRRLVGGGLLLAVLLVATAVVVSRYVAAAERRLKTTRQRLSDQNEALQAANADLEAFAHVVAHDLKNPLFTIAGFADLAMTTDGDTLSPTGRDAVATVKRQAARMDGIIDGLLAYATAGSRELHTEAADLTELATDAAQRLAATVTAHGGEVTIHPLPTALVDPVLVGQVLQNLIANGIQYGDPDHPLVEVADASDEEWIRVAVSDNGAGIDPSERERVFTMFERGRAGATRRGAGIGLALARRIAERHHGALRLDDAAATTTFVLELPASAAVTEGERPGPEARR